MNWLMILIATLAVLKADASEIEPVSITSTSSSYEGVSQENFAATTVVESSLETSTTPEVTKILETTQIPVVSERESEIVELPESKTDVSLLPTTDVAFQGTEAETTTVSSWNENYVVLSPDKESENIEALASTEESITVSAENSKVSQSPQTEPVTEEFKEVETDKTTVQPIDFFVSSNIVENQDHLVIPSTPTHIIPESTKNTLVETSSVFVTPLSETSQPVHVETSPALQPNTEKTILVTAVSETSQSVSVQTEPSTTLTSSSREPSPSPFKPELLQTSTEQIKTKPVLLEVLGGTLVSASEKPTQSLHTLIPDPSTHVTVVNRVPSIDKDALIVHQENTKNADGSYKHGFESSNGITFQEEGVLRDYNKTDEESGNPVRNIVTRGGFAWTAPNGQKIGIKYYADETGYHPEGDVIPTPPPSPPQILKALAWIRKVLAEKKEKELKMQEELLKN